jgi:carbon-monoxide dehydrogenase large subunit
MYDSGNHDGTLDKLLEHVDVAGFRAEQERLRSEGVYRGIGFCTYTEVCGVAPTRVFGPPGSACRAAAGSPAWCASTRAAP